MPINISVLIAKRSTSAVSKSGPKVQYIVTYYWAPRRLSNQFQPFGCSSKCSAIWLFLHIVRDDLGTLLAMWPYQVLLSGSYQAGLTGAGKLLFLLPSCVRKLSSLGSGQEMAPKWAADTTLPVRAHTPRKCSPQKVISNIFGKDMSMSKE